MNTIDLNEKTSDLNTDLIKCTASLVAAYVSRNVVGVGDLPVLIDQVHTAISVLQGSASGSGPGWTGPTAAQIESSIQQDGLISFIDGRSYKTLKRHLTAHGLTPERYRAKYGLPADYPMVAPGYAAKRSEIAKAIQLGHKAA
ncbi:transcriptional regulator, MucR family [Methylobacterium sp. UNC378MF]|jgi:predicted transcriptional regulator|uniref:MucR family transcriptional regulator n=1 Tax=Methylobacterium sp. UNC378MF TaxID=1502748 RepID=UPI000887A4E2|nr:MucR family transcriptional regulator [Methylobacterium sp. UNC378MF]SDA11587.1 transcriptional regulator, MucR family [Methylobacterium sp. UNC378MF]